jgi:N-acetyl-anhydromuramyl-L-alanine amidase AmpD
VLVAIDATEIYRALIISPIEPAFQQATSEFGVPEDLLKALCYMEGGLSIHGGVPNADGGYGCNLAKNSRVDTLDAAAQKLGVSPTQIRQDLRTNIRGAAYILSEDARRLSPSHRLPTNLAGWQRALELYSNSRSPVIALLYANEVYTLLKQGFSISTDQGEVITVTPQSIPLLTNQLSETAAPTTASPTLANHLPKGCRNDGKTDYPGAIDCIVSPAQHDCDLVPGTNSPCNYFSSSHFGPSYRQNDGTITHVVIHDTEASLQSTINAFESPKSIDTSHYVVDSDGTVYQMVHEKDVAFHAGNFWFNQHSVGIEHIGYDATGFRWYNAAQLLSSARLVAYLLNKYHIPLDHNHIVSHGTVPSTTLASSPNHVDPGLYWPWDYYLDLIRSLQGFAETPSIQQPSDTNIITLHHPSIWPFVPNGAETRADSNFFYLYKGPDTHSGLLPQLGPKSDITDETNNVEAGMSYYYVDKVQDEAGTGDTMYEIWYGETDQTHASKPNRFYTHARLAWLAVPPGAVSSGTGMAVELTSADGSPIQVSGRPTTSTPTVDYHIGNAPKGAIFVSGYTTVEATTHTVWYSINYNHRQAWVPASNVIMLYVSPLAAEKSQQDAKMPYILDGRGEAKKVRDQAKKRLWYKRRQFN